MKRASILIAAVSLSYAAPARGAGWRVVFEDNFDGTELDRNHDLANGILSLVARPVRDGRGASYESGMIRSRRTFYYGYFETRVFLPDARGAWPAFWLNSDYDGDGR